jgi:hypothetical protein
MRSAAFAIVMLVVAAAAGLWVVYGTGNAAGWVLVAAAIPWALLAFIRLTGGPRKLG